MIKRCIRLEWLCFLFALAIGSSGVWAQELSKTEAFTPDAVHMLAGEPADMSKPVQVFILMGQSNMVGMGKIDGGEGSLVHAVKEKKKYADLVDATGNWSERQDVRFVRFMQGRGLMVNNWMQIKPGTTIGPEFGIGQCVGNAIDAPVMLLKTCIGNRSLGWDYLPPGSERFVENGKVYAGYQDKPDSWNADPAKGVATEPPPWLDKNGNPVNWYAGKQYDEEVSFVRKALAELDKYYPGATTYEIAGFFFWQGEKDGGNAVHAAHYEQNLVNFIKKLRQDLNCPNAKFVLATMGEAVKGSGNKVLEGQLAVDGTSGKYPEFKGNVATVYTHPMAQGGSGNGHYGGKAEVYMDVGEAMGQAMIDLLQIAMPGPAAAQPAPGFEPKEWPANPAKHQVVVRRDAADKQQSAMIAAAEAAPPSQETLRQAAEAPDRNDPLGLTQPKEAPSPAGESVWWYKEQLGIRIPCAVTADAVTYYSDLVEIYGKQVLKRYTEPSSRLDYQASVKFHNEYKVAGKTFTDVHVVTLKLIFDQNFAATATEGMHFEKERVVVLDAGGKVLHISGDGPTEVPILAL